MPVVRAHQHVCQGYANCVIGAPDHFDLNDDGIVIVLKAEVGGADRVRVTEAARSCPVSALVVEDQ